jgi:flagellar assembly protein FliH
MGDVHPFDLRSFDADVEARADLERLREEIRTLEAERTRLVEEARREGFEAGRAEGVERGLSLEHARVTTETAGLADQLRAAAAAIREAKGLVAAEGERDLVKLAIAIAEKIVKSQVALGKPVAEENLRRAVELTAERREMQVLIHPDDLRRLEEYLPELRRDFADVRTVAFQADASIAKGGAVVRTRERSVDATIPAQLEQIERGLLG